MSPVAWLALANRCSAGGPCSRAVSVGTSARPSRSYQTLRSCLDSAAPRSVAMSLTCLAVDVAPVLVGASAMGGDCHRHGDDERHAGHCDELHASPLPERNRTLCTRKTRVERASTGARTKTEQLARPMRCSEPNNRLGRGRSSRTETNGSATQRRSDPTCRRRHTSKACSANDRVDRLGGWPISSHVGTRTPPGLGAGIP